MGEHTPICLVTGGRGFAARHLVLQLLRSGAWIVRIMDLASQIILEEEEKTGPLGEALADGRAQYVCADLRVKSQVFDACKGVVVVFHMAAPDSSINNFKLHYNVTVTGTRNVIDACIGCKVKKLIYTSSPSVIFDGIHGIINGNESLPYPDKHNDVYSETKAQAEALVLSANGKAGLVTCALRPSSIFGPGDKLLVPSLVSGARSGKMKFILGDGENMYDFTYVENVAHAHICAEQALVAANRYGEEVAAGKAFFVTNMEPRRFWDFVSEILEGLGYDRPKIHIPIKVLMPLAQLVEWTYKQFASFGVPPPQFTPSRLRLVTCWRTFNCARAEKLLGYKPLIPLQEGMRRTVDSYSHLRAERYMKKRDLGGPSKAHVMLGGGRVANILLWRNEKLTFATALAVFGLVYFLFFSGYTFISIAAKCLLLLVITLFLQRFLPSTVFGFQIPKISPGSIEMPEEPLRVVGLSLRSLWNPMWQAVENVGYRQNWFSFLKIVLFACFLKMLGKFSFSTVVGAVVVATFIVFYVYDQKEEEIDEIVKSVLDVFSQGKTVVMGRIPSSLKERFQER